MKHFIKKLNISIYSYSYIPGSSTTRGQLPSTIYNMNSRVVSNIQPRAESERLYVRYNMNANIVKYMYLDVNVWM